MTERIRVQRVDGRIVVPGYQFIAGAPIEGEVAVVAGHFHVKGKPDDGATPPEEFPYRALERGIDELIPTGHNSLGGFEQMQREVANNNLPLALTRAFEYEAREDGKPEHVLALNPDYVPPPGLTVVAANRELHRQGPDVLTIAPHPGHGNYSVSLKKVAHIQTNGFDPDQKFDGVEYNAGAEKARRFGKKLLIRPFAVLFSELPERDLNQEVAEYMEGEGVSAELFAFGGGDGHGDDDFDDAIMLRPANKSTTESLRAREVIILMKEKLQIPYLGYVQRRIYAFLGL